MNTMQTINNNVGAYKQPSFQYQTSVGTINTRAAVNQAPSGSENSSAYIQSSSAASSTRSLMTSTRNVNDTIGLVQSVDSSASVIESKLYDMKSIAMDETQCACQRIKKAQESISNIANNFSWNGKNFMVGGGENDQTTTVLSYNVNTGVNPADKLRIDFKSFNPMSAVDTEGELEPTKPNLPNLNKSEGTDNHAYGNAAFYSSLKEENYLHVHSKATRANAIIQLNRAIDGIKAERSRLSDYLSELDVFAKKAQKKSSNSNLEFSEIENINHAKEMAEISMIGISENPSLAILAQTNDREPQLRGLLQ